MVLMYQSNFKKFRKSHLKTSDINVKKEAVEASYVLSFNEHFHQDFYRYLTLNKYITKT